MRGGNLRARIFISCGQRKNSEEEELAHRIKDRLYDLGYDPYVAVKEQSLRGVKENIFQQLKTSEFFIFVDFKREQLKIKEKSEPIYRGSLFSHQELAIASFLDLPVIAFQEEGVKPDDGILKYIQANCEPFTDRDELPNVIADYVQSNWDPHWKNEIALERDNGDFEDVNLMPDNIPTRFFHIKVKNHNKRKPALNCLAYLECIKDFQKNEEKRFETVELKWKGVNFPNVTILPGSHRYFDGFFVYPHLPHEAYLSLSPSVDFTGYFYKIIGPGDFELVYNVQSQNFRPAKRHFKLHLGRRLEEILFHR